MTGPRGWYPRAPSTYVVRHGGPATFHRRAAASVLVLLMPSFWACLGWTPLLDHAAELRDALGELLEDEEVSVELTEDTLEQAARVWSPDAD